MALTNFKHKVTWNEFRIISKSPPGKDFVAEIYWMTSPWSFVPDDEGKPIKVASVTIKLYVDKTKSWVVKGKENPKLLRHEQIHYDIAAIGIREFCNQVLNLAGDSVKEIQTQGNNILSEITKKIKRKNEAYDNQTNHGIRSVAQQSWESKIRSVKQKPNGTLGDL